MFDGLAEYLPDLGVLPRQAPANDNDLKSVALFNVAVPSFK